MMHACSPQTGNFTGHATANTTAHQTSKEVVRSQ